mgnify:CR=1 FL=1
MLIRRRNTWPPKLLCESENWTLPLHDSRGREEAKHLHEFHFEGWQHWYAEIINQSISYQPSYVACTLAMLYFNMSHVLPSWSLKKRQLWLVVFSISTISRPLVFKITSNMTWDILTYSLIQYSSTDAFHRSKTDITENCSSEPLLQCLAAENRDIYVGG